MSELTLTEKQNNICMLKVQENALVISNIIELTTNVIMRISGKDISDNLNRKVVSNLVANYIKNRVFKKD